MENIKTIVVFDHTTGLPRNLKSLIRMILALHDKVPLEYRGDAWIEITDNFGPDDVRLRVGYDRPMTEKEAAEEAESDRREDAKRLANDFLIRMTDEPEFYEKAKALIGECK